MHVCASGVFRAPDCDGPDEVWINVRVVELLHRARWEEFRGVSEFLYDCLEFLDDVYDLC